MKKVYVASSWRNQIQPGVVATLRAAGFEVYDFRNPCPGEQGFHWSEVDPNWKGWNPIEFVKSLSHPVAESGFRSDWQAMRSADIGVLVLPCGRSAHIEAGYFVGAGKPLFILQTQPEEPELMYKMADQVCTNIEELIEAMNAATSTDESSLNFQQLRDANISRSAKWEGGTSPTIEFAMTELYGEAGEALEAIIALCLASGKASNFAKKLARLRRGIPGGCDTREHLAEELADTIICADLAAMHMNINLGEAIAKKFNATSVKWGFPDRLPV